MVKCLQLKPSKIRVLKWDLRQWTQHCFLCCIRLLLKYVFVGLWRFFCRLVRCVIWCFYMATHVPNRWLLRIPRIEHLIVKKSFLPAPRLLWLCRERSSKVIYQGTLCSFYEDLLNMLSHTFCSPLHYMCVWHSSMLRCASGCACVKGVMHCSRLLQPWCSF